MSKSDSIDQIKQLIEELVAKMGVEADVEIREQPETAVFNIRTEDTNMLIGKYGVNLYALQYLCRVLARRKVSEPLEFLIDVDDYKRKRESHLENLAEQVYKEIRNDKKIIVLKPMPAYERRVIHSALSSHSDVVTDSVGEEPNRMVVLKSVGFSKDLDLSSLKFGEEQEYMVLE